MAHEAGLVRGEEKKEEGEEEKEFANSSSHLDSDKARERGMLLELIRNTGSSHTVWTDLPEPFQIDKEFVLTAIRHMPVLPQKHLFERKFPQSLRFDREVALAFCARPDFAQLYEQRHLYPPPCLTSDKEVMIAYCRKIPRSLQECSEELADDREVVEAAIGLDGLNLQYASLRLQEDPGVIRSACRNDGQALELVPPGPIKDRLCDDRDFMMDAIRRKGGSVWRLASDSLKTDRELLLGALVGGMPMRLCPAPFREDRDFLCDALERNALLYLELPQPVQTDRDMAIAALSSPTTTRDVHARALELLPALRGSRDVVLAVARRGDADVASDMFLSPGNERFLDDKEIVMAVVAKRPSLFNRVSPRLRINSEVFAAAMTGSEVPVSDESCAGSMAGIAVDLLPDAEVVAVPSVARIGVKGLPPPQAATITPHAVVDGAVISAQCVACGDWMNVAKGHCPSCSTESPLASIPESRQLSGDLALAVALQQEEHEAAERRARRTAALASARAVLRPDPAPERPQLRPGHAAADSRPPKGKSGKVRSFARRFRRAPAWPEGS
jgi:hypothetical protein